MTWSTSQATPGRSGQPQDWQRPIAARKRSTCSRVEIDRRLLGPFTKGSVIQTSRCMRRDRERGDPRDMSAQDDLCLPPIFATERCKPV